MREVRRKLHSACGVSALLVALALAAAALAVSIALPTLRDYGERAEKYGCDAAIDSASRVLTADFLLKMETLTPREARAALAEAMPGRETICPAGGEIYLIPRADGTYELFCGLHGSDPVRRRNLNGENVREQVEEELKTLRLRGESVPDTLTVTLNGAPLTVTRVEEKADLHFGTKLTPGYEGTVALFLPGGDGDLDWFCFADEDAWVEYDYTGGGKG